MLQVKYPTADPVDRTLKLKSQITVKAAAGKVAHAMHDNVEVDALERVQRDPKGARIDVDTEGLDVSVSQDIDLRRSVGNPLNIMPPPKTK